MNRSSFLRWFYVAVQFIMLAVSIPKVGALFHAYDTQTFGLVLGGIDVRSWLVGVAIDLTATFTTWAAMAKYDETRKRTALIAPAVIILFCSALSVIANYEDAATLLPQQYAQVSVFAQPALYFNPLLISTPPVLVLLLILLVPSVLARPRLKSAEEIAAEADEEVAKIEAKQRVRETRAKANAGVLGVRLQGMKEAVSSLRNQPASEDEEEEEGETLASLAGEAPGDSSPLPAARMTRAMWQAMRLPDRVVQSGVITASEVADILGISPTHARNLTKGIESGTQKLDGRSGVPYQDLIDALHARRTKDSFEWARKLEKVLGVRKRSRQAPERLVTDELNEMSEVAQVSEVGEVL